jgi:hypothetical protein
MVFVPGDAVVSLGLLLVLVVLLITGGGTP